MLEARDAGTLWAPAPSGTANLTSAGPAHYSYPWELWEMAKRNRSRFSDTNKMDFLKVCHKSKAGTVTFTGREEGWEMRPDSSTLLLSLSGNLKSPPLPKSHSSNNKGTQNVIISCAQTHTQRGKPE